MILLRYSCRRGDLFVRSCARVRRIDLGSVCSSLLMFGAMMFMTLLGASVLVYLVTISVWMCFMFCLIVSFVVSSGGVSWFVV